MLRKFVVCCLWFVVCGLWIVVCGLVFVSPISPSSGSWIISMCLNSLTFCETIVPVEYFQPFELIEPIEPFEPLFSAQLFYNTPE